VSGKNRSAYLLLERSKEIVNREQHPDHDTPKGRTAPRRRVRKEETDHALPAQAAQGPRLRPVERVFDADSAGREAARCRGTRIFRNAEDPQEVVVLFEWDSLESARRRIESATLSRKFVEAGVSRGIGQTEFYLLEGEAQTTTS
jgi:hypothetical protein